MFLCSLKDDTGWVMLQCYNDIDDSSVDQLDLLSSTYHQRTRFEVWFKYIIREHILFFFNYLRDSQKL